MATLIQSKQIEGVVTASVIQGEFSVQSGSVNLSGATGVTGSFTGSFIGDGSQLTFGGTGLVSGSSQITISQTSGYTIFSSSLDSRLVSLENATDNTGSDSQTLSISGDQLTISSGNTIIIPTGSGGASSWNELSDIPSGLISGSTFTNFSSSVDLRIVGISASGSGADWNSNLQNIPNGLVSGSVLRTLDGTGVLSGSIVDQLPSGVISGSSQLPSGLVSSSAQITDGSGIVSGSVLRTLDGTGVISGSVLRTLDGTGVLSGSIVDQLPSGIISGSTFTSFSSSVDSRLDTLENATDNTGSDTQSLSISGDQLTISDGNTVTIPTGSGGSVPAGTISGSAQITAFGFTSGSHTDIPSGTISSSEQVISSLPSGVISGSTQITDGSGIFSGSLVAGTNITINQDGNNFIISSSASGGGSVPSGTISGSAQITSLGFISESFSTDGTGILSGSIVDQLPGGIISGSTYTTFSSSVDSRILTEKSRIDNILSGANADYDQFVEIVNLVNSTDTENDTAFANHYTSSRQRLTSLENFTQSIDTTIKTKLNTDDVLSGSIESLLPSGLVSGSTQITDGSGIVSGSVLRTLDGTNVFSGSLIAGSNVTITSGSGNITISSSGGDSVPAGTISSSAQITSLGFISESFSTDGTGIVSGSVLRTLDGTGIVSGSVLRTLDGTGVVSGSVLRNLDSTGVFSGSLVAGNNITINQVGDNFEISSSASGGGSVPSGTVSSSAQTITHLYGTSIFSGSIIGQGSITITSGSGNITISGSGGSSDITYDGNRVISNEDLGDLFTNSVNPGTSGSIQDFLNAVFYPNTGPSISTGNQTILEYVSSGSSIVTLSGTDPEGQTITFGTASSYTDDLVRVESGVLKLNALAESSSFNTDSVGGSHGHQVTVTATDTFGTVTEKDIYVIVTPNEAPKFRQTSVGGSVITSFTANLNENSTNGTVAGTIYFTDEESDTITISSSSIDNNHFVINKYATYVQIVQNTGSLDYEEQTSYSFSISASDEHYEAGQDSDSITTLPITINVTDNQIPVVNNQTLSSINENSSNGATVDSIAASDNEGDTITFVNFNLHKLLLDGVEVSSGSYGGTSQLTDPHENPFQMSSTGVVTRKNGVYLNSDLINSYQYRVQVKDNFNTSSPASIITIPIIDDTPATLSDNWSAGPYIKESEENGTTIKTTNYGSTAADYGSNQSGTWSSSNSAISINSNGTLSLGVDLSGSVTQSGDTLDSTITFTNTFGTTTTDSLSLTIVANDAPTATFTNQSSNFNTNLATDGTTMVSMSISDTEGDTPYSVSLSGTNASDLQLKYTNVASSSVGIQANGNLSAGTYNYDVVVTDSYSESTTYSGRSFTIASASTGTLSTNGTLYVIESATNGDNIVLNSNGRTGTQGSVSVSYSPNYGSQSASSFTSSNGLISINSSTGVLSVGTDISGSGNVNGDTITSTIGWTDQYGNVGSDTITVNVAKNNAPSVSSTQTFNTNTNQATGSSEIVRLNLSDTEGDTIPNSSLSFTNYNSTYFTPSISTPQMKLLVNSTSIPAGSYPYTASIEDEHGFETRVHSGSVTIVQASTGSLGGDTAIYIIESATTGSVFRDQTGFNEGNAAQLSVSYSPNYGSQVVQSYTSSRQGISVDSSGNLTAGYDFSGSVTSTDYTSTALVSDSTNSTLYGKSLHVNGIKIVQGAATGSQSAVPDAFTEKVAQTIKLMVTSSGADINDTDQANMIGILKGETGTWHSGYPTAQRILRGAGSDYSPNPLIDSNYSSYPGLQNFQDSHATNDMIWYLNSSAASGSGDDDIVEVIEHLMHTIHQYGVRGAVSGSFYGLSWDPDTDSDWNTRELYLAIKEAVDDSVFDISDYGDASYNTASTFKLIAKEYLYLLNFNMWEYSSLWDGGSLSPEWNDNSRTPSGIQTNNPLGYALYNKYIKPVLTKPSKTVLQNIFQDGDVGDPTVAGSSGYTPEVGTGLISKITFRDQYDNIGSGSVTATIFGNSSPSANFTDNSLNSDEAISGSDIGTLTVTDTENNSPFTITLAGTDGGKFDVSGSTSPFTIEPTGSLVAGSYSINITVTDNYGESVTLTNESIVVSAAADYGKVYIYTSTRTGGGLLSDGNYDGLLGITSENTSTEPDLITGYQSSGPSPIYAFKTGYLGSGSVTVGGGTMTLRNTVSGSNLDTIISSSFNGDGSTAEQIMIIFPSGSDMDGIPTSMTDSLGGSTNGEYVLYLKAAGDTSFNVEGTQIHMFDVDSAVEGYTRWNIIGRNSVNTASSYEVRLIPSSGSAP